MVVDCATPDSAAAGYRCKNCGADFEVWFRWRYQYSKEAAENAQLRRENERLRRELEKTQLIVDAQKKLAQVLGLMNEDEAGRSEGA